MMKHFNDNMMIGAPVADVVAYCEKVGVKPYIEEETEYEAGLIATSKGAYDDRFEFDIVDGVVDSSGWVLWD